MYPEVRVIGRHVPTTLDANVLMTELRPLLPPCCQRERISVREPDARTSVHPDNLAWHQDGGGVLGTVRHMIVWASETPTQIKLSDGTEFCGEPYDLVWFNNDIVYHRQPAGTDEGARWFVSIRCSGDPE